MDFPATMLWPPGNVLMQNKYALSVTHKRLGIIQAGHDLGMMLPHVQIAPAPNNFFTPLHILFSSRKVSFNSSSVKANGAFVGFAGVIAPLPTPMLVCGDPMSFPMGEVPTRWSNNVWAGFSYMDLALGAMNMGVTLFMERLAIPKTKLGKLRKIVEEQREGRAALMYKTMFPVQSLKDAKTALTKQWVAVSTGLITGVVQGEGAISLTLGSSFASVALGVSVDSTRAVSASLSTNVPAVSESVSYKQGSGSTVAATANWGTGGTTVERSPSGAKTTSHNALDGSVSVEETSR
jgi:hypothetical protein